MQIPVLKDRTNSVINIFCIVMSGTGVELPVQYYC